MFLGINLALNKLGNKIGSTYILLTSGSTWTVPDDWNNASNTIEAIGAGGNGADGINNTSSGGGGGGGEYRKIVNQSFEPGSVVNIQIATGGSEADTYLQDNTNTSVIIAKPGLNAVGPTGGAGGTGGTGASANYDGGAGGNGRSATGAVGAAGGGGSAGPIGIGKGAGSCTASGGGTGGGGSNGGASTSSSNASSNTGTAGGKGTSGTGGGAAGGSNINGRPGTVGGGGGGGTSTTSARNGGNGGVDNSFGPAIGSSGGGGGSASGTASVGGDGGTYGGGGGGGCSNSSGSGTGGDGGKGIIAISYTPAIPGEILTVQKFYTSSQATAIRIRPKEQTRNYVIVRNTEATNVAEIAFVSSANNFTTPPTTGFTDINPGEEWYEEDSTNQIWIRAKVAAAGVTVEIETSVPRT